MQTDFYSIENSHDLIIHLLSLSYFYSDYSILFHMMNTSSSVYLSVKKKDIAALRKFAERNWIDFEKLTDEQRKELESIYQEINDKYGQQIQDELSPLPNQFLSDFGDRAIGVGHYKDAYSALIAIKELDKKVNESVAKSVELLKSKEVSDPGSGDMVEVDQKVSQAADLAYMAARLKKPFGGQFQYLGENLHYKDSEAMRKFTKYVELNLLKELVDFSIHFLFDDKQIADKMTQALPSGKVRKMFLRYLAIKYSNGEERYKQFVDNYASAVEKLSEAKTEVDYFNVQKTLLGRGTGENVYHQFLRELSLEHPISAMLVITQATPNGEPFIAPLILKSGVSLLDFLELGNV